MRKLILAAAVAATVLALAAGANAITYGAPDGDAHPEVGAPARAGAILRRHVDDVLRDADLADRLPDCGAL